METGPGDVTGVGRAKSGAICGEAGAVGGDATTGAASAEDCTTSAAGLGVAERAGIAAS
jgi:hypothetical protein